MDLAEDQLRRQKAAYERPQEEWITNEELAAVIQTVYPSAVSGKDFYVGHGVEGDVQTTDAFIIAWRLPTPEPTESVLREMVRLRKQEAQNTVKCRRCREQRAELLAAADVKAAQALDAGDMEAVKRIGAYRQALRDLPKQPGFPDNVEWPVLPE